LPAQDIAVKPCRASSIASFHDAFGLPVLTDRMTSSSREKTREGYTMTRRTIICMFLALCLVLSTGVFSMCHAQGGGSPHNEQGCAYFKKGFYEYAPHNKHQEANQYYEMAVVEFKKAIAANDGDVAAHRNLARVYHVQQKYALSAAEYKRVTELSPEDVDAYVNLAVAYSHLNKYDKAIEQLELAKTKTSDPVAIGKLNGYIEKLEKARNEKN
jgi:tetratricopeptide (TPR) repeat protein